MEKDSVLCRVAGGLDNSDTICAAAYLGCLCAAVRVKVLGSNVDLSAKMKCASGDCRDRLDLGGLCIPFVCVFT